MKVKVNPKKLKELLHNNEVLVEFIKKNGEHRKMRCTLNVDFIKENFPEFEHPKGKRTPKEGVVSVWDLEKKGWRSIIIDNVQEYNITKI